MIVHTKSALVTIGALLVVSAGYVVRVADALARSTPEDVSLGEVLLGPTIALVILVTVAHIVLAAMSPDAAARRPRHRPARHQASNALLAATVMGGIALTVLGATPFLGRSGPDWRTGAGRDRGSHRADQSRSSHRLTLTCAAWPRGGCGPSSA